MSLSDLIAEAEKETVESLGTERLPVCETTSFPIPDASFVMTRSDLEVILTALANMNIMFPDNKALDEIHNYLRESIGMSRVDEASGLDYAMSYMSVSASSREARASIELTAWQWDLILLAVATSAEKGPKKHRESFRSSYRRLSGEAQIAPERLDSVGCSGCGIAISIQSSKLTPQGYRCPLC